MHEDAPEEVVHAVHRSALARPSARPAGARHRRHVKAATREKVRRFYRKHYVPGQLVVAAAGNLRHGTSSGRSRADGRRSGRRGAGAPGMEPPGPRVGPDLLVAPADQAAEDRAGAHLPGDERLARSDPDWFAFLIVNGALGTGMSSRCSRASARSAASRTPSTAITRSTPRRAVRVLRGDDAGARARGCRAAPRRAGRRRGRRAHRGGVRAREGPRDGLDGAVARGPREPDERIGKSEIGHGEILTVNQSLKRVQDVTLDDARRVAKRVLAQPMTLTVLGPFAKRDLAEAMA